MSDDRGLPTSEESTKVDVRRLGPGDILGNRFAIVRFLAHGGMGEVYEAADRHLQGKHCALKILRPDIASTQQLRLRFEREVLLAREVRHPNVCPTYDLFHEQGPNGPITFMTMKLIRGESLQSRMKRVGLFDVATLTLFAKQMSEALDAAHRVGIVHRDFKPGNVMIEFSGHADPQIAITDFGLARAYEAEGGLSQTGQLLGTPGYIAPELMRGQVASFAADVYAFGVVLYEMATGRKPEPAKGKDTSTPPSTFAPNLPAVWDRVILGCLEWDPARRFQSAGEAVALLDEPKSGRQSSTIGSKIPVRRRWMIASLFTILIGISSWLFLPNLDALLHPLPQKRFVALLMWPPDSNPNHLPLLKSVIDTVGRRLARAETTTKDLLVIAPGDVTGASITAPVDAVSALGANLVLAVSTHETNTGIVVDLAVIDAVNSKELRKSELVISNSDVSRLPDRAAVSASKLLDVQLSGAQWKDRDELANVSPAAYRFFTQGENLSEQPNEKGIDQAIEQYQKALEADDHFALGYARLAMAYIRKYRLTRDSAVLSLASRNADLAMRYNPGSPQSLLGRALADLESGKSQEALDGLARALQLDPGNPLILSNRARLLRDLDRRSDEEKVYRAIIADRPNYWPAYNLLGLNLYRQGKYPEAITTFAEGSAIAPRIASFFTNRGAVELALNHKKEAEEAFRSSIERAPSETAYSNLGTLAFENADYRRALEYYSKARDLNPKNDGVWRNIGDTYAMIGDKTRVDESYTTAAELLSAALRTNPKRGSSWMTLAFYEAKIGHRSEAEAAMASAEERGATDLQSLFKKAQILTLLGRKNEAIDLIVACLMKGLSQTDVDLAVDLAELRKDPRYLRAMGAHKAGSGHIN
jgi:eukaryotic-like serine/threonine-protein kinase